MDMSEIPTPETDAFILSQDYSPTGHQWRNFTRQLERERDEVKEKLADWENSAAHVEEDCACVPVLRKLLADARKERDEAREALREIWQSGDAFLPHVDRETTSRWRKAAGWDEAK
jgi:hypothetical protein